MSTESTYNQTRVAVTEFTDQAFNDLIDSVTELYDTATTNPLDYLHAATECANAGVMECGGAVIESTVTTFAEAIEPCVGESASGGSCAGRVATTAFGVKSVGLLGKLVKGPIDNLLGLACRVNSFTAGTRVLMADWSTKRIEDIAIGDLVWATDPKTGVAGPRQVLDTIVGDGEKQLIDIDLLGDSLTATDGHPFWVGDQGRWVDASDLQPGDGLLLADGSTAVVSEVEDWVGLVQVHNLTVEGIHTYHVVINDAAVLVHNCRVDELGGLAGEFDADELAQFAYRHSGAGDIPDRPSLAQIENALTADGVRIRDGLDGRDPAVMFRADGVTVIINEANPLRSTSFLD